MGTSSPFFRTLPPTAHGLAWIHLDAPIAHPFDDGTAATLALDLRHHGHGRPRTREPYRRLVDPLVAHGS
jgi:phytoene dehydrogenase-like protein